MNKNLLLSIVEIIKNFDQQIKSIEKEILSKIDISSDYEIKHIEKFYPVDIKEVIEAVEENKEFFLVHGTFEGILGIKMVTLKVPTEWLFKSWEELKEEGNKVSEKEKARRAASKKVKEAFDNLMELEKEKESLLNEFVVKEK